MGHKRKRTFEPFILKEYFTVVKIEFMYEILKSLEIKLIRMFADTVL